MPQGVQISAVVLFYRRQCNPFRLLVHSSPFRPAVCSLRLTQTAGSGTNVRVSRGRRTAVRSREVCLDNKTPLRETASVAIRTVRIEGGSAPVPSRSHSVFHLAL